MEQESNRQRTMEDIDRGLHPAVDRQSLGERWKFGGGGGCLFCFVLVWFLFFCFVFCMGGSRNGGKITRHWNPCLILFSMLLNFGYFLKFWKIGECVSISIFMNKKKRMQIGRNSSKHYVTLIKANVRTLKVSQKNHVIWASFSVLWRSCKEDSTRFYFKTMYSGRLSRFTKVH